EPEKKQHMVNSIANFMKVAYVLWNKDHVADEQILSDLNTLSNGELDLSQIVFQKVDIRPPAPAQNNTGRSQKTNNRGGSNNGGGRQNNNQNNKGRQQRSYQNNNGGGKRS